MFSRRFLNKKEGLNKLIVGLGNYGSFYEHTRHNAGFDAIDFIAEKFGVNFRAVKKFNAFFGKGKVANRVCGFLKPLTFMNSSGVAVSKACKFYKLQLDDVIVLVDDVSFEPGKIRIRQKGSAGTHNGLKSIVLELGGSNFIRIKIGVGKKPSPNFDLAKWVISKFDEASLADMVKSYAYVASAVELILDGNIDRAMNIYN